MKRILIAICTVLLTLTLHAQENTTKKEDAKVNLREGVYLFMYSQPAKEYTYLGTLKIKAAWTGQPNEMLNIALRKLKKDYPQADGIIFNGEYMDRIDAIKFK